MSRSVDMPPSDGEDVTLLVSRVVLTSVGAGEGSIGFKPLEKKWQCVYHTAFPFGHCDHQTLDY